MGSGREAWKRVGGGWRTSGKTKEGGGGVKGGGWYFFKQHDFLTKKPKSDSLTKMRFLKLRMFLNRKVF